MADEPEKVKLRMLHSAGKHSPGDVIEVEKDKVSGYITGGVAELADEKKSK
jgi:hypothetical protein